MTTIQQAMCNTLLYADLFDFPLTLQELTQRLIGMHCSQHVIEKEVRRLPFVACSEGYMFLAGRQHLVAMRKQRISASKKKWRIAKRIVHVLSFIPTIRLIGVSGGLASDNAQDNDDIDLFLITQAGAVWQTRIAVLAVLEFLRRRRRPGMTSVKDMICANMLVDERQLHLPPQEQDIFGAHEVLLMRPVWQKPGTYMRFLSANSWVESYLPGWYHTVVTNMCSEIDIRSSVPFPIAHIDRLCQAMQQWYMRSRRTTEVIEAGRVRFHPRDLHRTIVDSYQERAARYGQQY